MYRFRHTFVYHVYFVIFRFLSYYVKTPFNKNDTSLHLTTRQ